VAQPEAGPRNARGFVDRPFAVEGSHHVLGRGMRMRRTASSTTEDTQETEEPNG